MDPLIFFNGEISFLTKLLGAQLNVAVEYSLLDKLLAKLLGEVTCLLSIILYMLPISFECQLSQMPSRTDCLGSADKVKAISCHQVRLLWDTHLTPLSRHCFLVESALSCALLPTPCFPVTSSPVSIPAILTVISLFQQWLKSYWNCFSSHSCALTQLPGSEL